MAIDKGYGGMRMGGNRLMRQGGPMGGNTLAALGALGGMGGFGGGMGGSPLAGLMAGGMGTNSFSPNMNMDQAANYFTQAVQQNQANPGSVDPNIMAQAANFARNQHNPRFTPGNFGLTPGGAMGNPAFRQPNWQAIFGPTVDRYQAAADAANQPQPSNYRQNTNNVLRTIGARLGGLGGFLSGR